MDMGCALPVLNPRKNPGLDDSAAEAGVVDPQRGIAEMRTAPSTMSTGPLAAISNRRSLGVTGPGKGVDQAASGLDSFSTATLTRAAIGATASLVTFRPSSDSLLLSATKPSKAV